MPEPDDLAGAPSSAASAAGRMVGAAFASSKRAAGRAREGIRSRPAADRAYRTAVGVTGGATVALGVVLMPLPGPGTLVALGGLAVLGSEFEGGAEGQREGHPGGEGGRSEARRAAGTKGVPTLRERVRHPVRDPGLKARA